MKKRYKILHIITGNYVCVICSKEDNLNNLLNQWAKYGASNCSFYLNETYLGLVDKETEEVFSVFTNKKLLQKIIKTDDFLNNIDVDLDSTFWKADPKKHLTNSNEFEIIEEI